MYSIIKILSVVGEYTFGTVIFFNFYAKINLFIRSMLLAYFLKSN